MKLDKVLYTAHATSTGKRLPINGAGAAGAAFADLGFAPEIVRGFALLARRRSREEEQRKDHHGGHERRARHGRSSRARGGTGQGAIGRSSSGPEDHAAASALLRQGCPAHLRLGGEG